MQMQPGRMRDEWGMNEGQVMTTRGMSEGCTWEDDLFATVDKTHDWELGVFLRQNRFHFASDLQCIKPAHNHTSFFRRSVIKSETLGDD